MQLPRILASLTVLTEEQNFDRIKRQTGLNVDRNKRGPRYLCLGLEMATRIGSASGALIMAASLLWAFTIKANMN